MKKYDLLRCADSIMRVLDVQKERVFVIDCIKQTMPVWVELELLGSYSECTVTELSEVTGIGIVDVDGIGDADTLDADQRKVMYERYTMIAPVLSVISDDKMRSRMICSISTEHKVSKQTVRNYLCLYLSYITSRW